MAVLYVSSRCLCGVIKRNCKHSRAFCAAPQIGWTANGFPYDPRDTARMEKRGSRETPISTGEMAAYRREVRAARTRFIEEIRQMVGCIQFSAIYLTFCVTPAK